MLPSFAPLGPEFLIWRSVRLGKRFCSWSDLNKSLNKAFDISSIVCLLIFMHINTGLLNSEILKHLQIELKL